MEGAYALEVVGAIERMWLPLTVKWADGFDNSVDAFAVDALQCAFASGRSPSTIGS